MTDKPKTKITCPCGASAETRRTHIEAIADHTGWARIWSARFGMKLIWLCPACDVKIRGAVRSLAGMLGRNAADVSWESLTALAKG